MSNSNSPKLPPVDNAHPGTKATDGGESARDEPKYRHTGISTDNRKEFNNKIFYFPPEYNALRRELARNWPSLWMTVQYNMAHNASEFVAVMNQALDMHLVFDTEKVAFICSTFLRRLEYLRLHGGWDARDIERAANFGTKGLPDLDDPEVQRKLQGVTVPIVPVNPRRR